MGIKPSCWWDKINNALRYILSFFSVLLWKNKHGITVLMYWNNNNHSFYIFRHERNKYYNQQLVCSPHTHTLLLMCCTQIMFHYRKHNKKDSVVTVSSSPHPCPNKRKRFWCYSTNESVKVILWAIGKKEMSRIRDCMHFIIYVTGRDGKWLGCFIIALKAFIPQTRPYTYKLCAADVAISFVIARKFDHL